MANHVERRVRPAVPYFGGKGRIFRRILEVAPPHRVYVEPFAGGLNVLLNKYRSEIEVACDVSTELVNFYCVLVACCEDLIQLMQTVKFERESLDAACAAGSQGDELVRAVNFLTRQRLSFSGLEGGGWANPGHRVMNWNSLAPVLRIVSRRLRGVRILVGSAFDAIPEYDSPETLYYLDPPYCKSTRVSGDYLHELGQFGHLRLLRLAKNLQGSVILSGYASLLYDQELSGWERVEIPATVASGLARNGKKPRRMEVLWVKSPVF